MTRLDDEDRWRAFPFEPEPYKPGHEAVIPKPVRDSDGREVVLVPVYHRIKPFTAKLFPADWEALQKAGYSDQWSLQTQRYGHKVYAYVMVQTGPYLLGPKAVARLLTEATIRECVKYRDGNPLNLRRDNLRVTDARR